LRVIQTLRNPQSRLDDISTDGRWLVWDDAVTPVNWTMYVCDLQTGAIRQLAASPQLNEQTQDAPHLGPLVSSGYVVWTEATTPLNTSGGNNYTSVLVQEENLLSGVVTTLTTGAYVEAFSWPWVAWDPIVSNTGNPLTLENLVSHQQWHFNNGPYSVSLDGATVALEDNAATQVQMIPNAARSSTPQTIFALNPAYNVQIGAVSMNARLVAWHGSYDMATPTVWDRAQQVTVTLPTHIWIHAMITYAAGPLLVWTDSAESAAQQQLDDQHNLTGLYTYYVVNTSQLPTKAPGA